MEIILKEEATVEEYVKDIVIFTFQGYVFPREIVQYQQGRACFYLGLDVYWINFC